MLPCAWQASCLDLAICRLLFTVQAVYVNIVKHVTDSFRSPAVQSFMHSFINWEQRSQPLRLGCSRPRSFWSVPASRCALRGCRRLLVLGKRGR